MTEIISVSSSRTNSCNLDQNPILKTTSSILFPKQLLIKPQKSNQLQRRRTLKLKSNTYENQDSCTISLKTLQSNPTKKISIKRKIVKAIEDLENVKYKPKMTSSNSQKVFQERVRLFDLKKNINYSFRCFKEDELGYGNEIAKLIIPTKIDNDVETDDETLKYYVKRCERDLLEAVTAERKKKEKKNNI